MMFLLKKMLAPLFFPVSLCLELLLLGLLLLWFTRKQKTGKVILSIGFLLFALLSYSAVSDELLRPLEYKYPPILKADDVTGVKWVVVLGGGHISDPRLPVTGQIGGASVARLVEGIRLYKMLPESKLILSGGSAFDPVANAEIMADVAIAMGVEKQDLILESSSKDTKDQAGLIREIVGKDSFLMVTSASHMPRSMALFENQGMRPIPAPTGYGVKKRQRASPGMFFPGAYALLKAEIAFHEYLGMAWAKIRGQM
jgi:uncharacterized SAM-binding protein YcdF (DUF218 family)